MIKHWISVDGFEEEETHETEDVEQSNAFFHEVEEAAKSGGYFVAESEDSFGKIRSVAIFGRYVRAMGVVK